MKILLLLLVLGVGLRVAVVAAEPAPVAAATAFDCQVFPSVQYAHTDIFFHTPSERPPELALTSEIAPGQRLDLLVLARNFGVDAASQAHVTYHLVIHSPNGKTQSPPDDVAIADHLKVDPRGLLFPKGVVSFSVAPGEPTGEYNFEVIAHDHVGGGTTTKSIAVRVTDSAEPLPLPAGFDPGRFLGDYYRRPQPRLALPALVAFSQSPLARRTGDVYGALLGFYDQVLADNPWLLPSFTARLVASTDATERRMLALVLAFAHRDDPHFGDDLPAPAKTALAATRQEPLPNFSPEPTTGGQLDLLWGQFLASGRFEPIARLVAIAASYLPYRGKLEEFKRLSPKPKTAPIEARKDSILGVALWSLGSNARQHQLVHDYLLGLQQAKDASPETKTVTQFALNWKPPARPGSPP